MLAHYYYRGQHERLRQFAERVAEVSSRRRAPVQCLAAGVEGGDQARHLDDDDDDDGEDGEEGDIHFCVFRGITQLSGKLTMETRKKTKLGVMKPLKEWNARDFGLFGPHCRHDHFICSHCFMEK